MNIAILLAAGSSTRAGQNKLWAEINGEPLWTSSYKTLSRHPLIGRIILVAPKGEEMRFLAFVAAEKTTIVSGGVSRIESFKRGLAAAQFGPNDVIIDNNAANPFVTDREISEVIEAAKEHGAAGVCHPLVDTLAETEPTENQKSNFCYIVSIKERKNFRLMQTPQAARGDILKNIVGNEAGDAPNESGDLSSFVHGYTQFQLIPADPLNKKITFAEDIKSLHVQTLQINSHENCEYFIGEDSHRFSDSGTLKLGGHRIPDLPALEANSDGDVILHAIGRALAQATSTNGESVTPFSEVADPLMLSGDMDSRDYLEPFLEKIKIRNVSISLECSRPKIDPIKEDIKKSLAEILSVPPARISIEAMSGEGLTPFGRGEGIRCTALIQAQKL